MAQFDFLIIFPLVFSLLLTLTLYYSIFIKVIIPNFFEAKKFRKKNLDSSFFYFFFKGNKNLNLENSYAQVIVF